MDRTRPAHDLSGAKAIQTDISVMTLIDLIAHDGPAITMRGQPVELARTSVGAVAVYEFATPYFPSGGSHLLLPMSQPERNPVMGRPPLLRGA
jgi:hypothetical protein